MTTLYTNRPSPYGRKVMVVAHEKGLSERIEIVQMDPWTDPAGLLAATPVGKVPALVTDEGLLLTESTTISEYLDAIGSGKPLLDGNRWDVLSRVGTAQGLIDAAFGCVIERRRPQERQWPDWIARQTRAIDRCLSQSSPRSGRFDLGDISLACGLAYMDFRLPTMAWRAQYPDIAAWLDDVNERPSMLATRPA
jgi:glutathione S-transferase